MVTEARPDLARPCVVYVAHQGSEKMVGVVIVRRGGRLIFLHALGGGNQYHRNTRCPAPIDLKLAVALGRAGIQTYYAYDRTNEILWKIPLDAVAAAPVAEYGERLRFYPPEEDWERLRGVTEFGTVRGGKTYHTEEGALLFASPYLPDDPYKVLV